MNRIVRCVCLILPWFLIASRATLGVDLSSDAAYQWGRELFETLVPEEIREEYEFPSPEMWNEFWSNLMKTLHEGSLEDLAWMRPAAESALTWLRMFPAGEPYADWLEQRLDFLQVAEEVVRQAPPPPPRRGPLRPPTPRPPPPPPPQSRERVRQAVRIERWNARIAARPPPPRAQSLAPEVERVFRAEGLPTELIWLAEVESSFNPHARSPAGAVGLFQLMPATATRFGLSVHPADERLIPERNATAAARYLRYLHRQFGTWPLAIAAYNAGEGRLQRAQRKAGSNEWEKVAEHLPMETRMYVPKVLATIQQRANANAEALPPPRA